MIAPLAPLQEARLLLLELLGDEIKEDNLDYSIYQLKIVLVSSIIIYLRYNEFGEYGYQIIFSSRKNDFIRFDNFDDKWDVPTKPHHLHQRGSKVVISSPMIGQPSHDMPLLVKYLKKS